MNEPETQYRTEVDAKMLTEVVMLLEGLIAEQQCKLYWSRIVRDALDKPEPKDEALFYLASLKERLCTAIRNSKPNPA
jgi:hypothetical protein